MQVVFLSSHTALAHHIVCLPVIHIHPTIHPSVLPLPSCPSVHARYFVFQDSGAFTPSATLYAAHMDDLQSGPAQVQCNPHDSGSLNSTGWPTRCLIPCVQYGFLDEPVFDYDLLSIGRLAAANHRPLCPCMNGTVYEVEREYTGATGLFMSESKCQCQLSSANHRPITGQSQAFCAPVLMELYDMKRE